MSKSELAFTVTSLLSEPPLRNDGRGLTDYRPIRLSTGVHPQANGSARVECGNTEIVVGVMATVTTVANNERLDGQIKCNVICSPSARPTESSSTLDDLSDDLTAILSSVYSDSSLLASDLSIIPKQKFWTLNVDALVLSCDGNLLDMLFLATRAALHDCRIPVTRSIQYKAQAGVRDQSGLDTRSIKKQEAVDFELKDFGDAGKLISNRDEFPIAITLCAMPPIHYLDPTQLEEAATPLKLLVVYSFRRNGSIHLREPYVMLIKSFGEGCMPAKEWKTLLTKGQKYAEELLKATDSRLTEEERILDSVMAR